MAEAVLENNYRRELSNAKNRSAGGDDGLESGEDSLADGQADAGRHFRQLMNLARQRGESGIDKARTEEFDKVAKLAKEAARRWAIRRISWAFGVTLVGFIVTFAIWTIQVIWGNWLKSEVVPALVLWELIAWGFCAVIVGCILILGIVLNFLALLVSLGPIVGLTTLGPSLFNILINAARDFIF